jgi:hypothetical protein
MRHTWFACICLTLAFGGMFCSQPKYQYEPGWYNGHLKTMREHLETISQQLKVYHSRNGKYPDNNEGLAALTEFRTKLSENRYDLPEPMGKLPKEYNEKIRSGSRDMAAYGEGILSPWLEPFIYENRTGLDAKLFADSPATLDTGRNYSAKVDEGVYIYSAGTMLFYREYKWLLIEMWSVRIIFCLLLILFIVLFARTKPKTTGKPPVWQQVIKGVGGTILILASLFVSQATMVTCYIMNSFGLYRRPEMMAEYNKLLEKYYQKGVINQATYDKVKKAMDEVNKVVEKK